MIFPYGQCLIRMESSKAHSCFLLVLVTMASFQCCVKASIPRVETNGEVLSRKERFRRAVPVGALVTGFEIIFSLTEFTLGQVQNAQNDNEMAERHKEIMKKLGKITRDISTLNHKLNNALKKLQIGQLWLEISIKHSDDVERLMYFLHRFNLLEVEENGSLGPTHNTLNIMNRSNEIAEIKKLCKERLAEQMEAYLPYTMQWPSQTYGLPMPRSGCPVSNGITWHKSKFKQDTDDNTEKNKWSNKKPFPKRSLSKEYIKQHFCMKNDPDSGEGVWPSGTYCIPTEYGNHRFHFSKTCPQGFSFGDITWHDEWNPGFFEFIAYLFYKGKTPYSHNSNYSKVRFCCRRDRPAQKGMMILPVRKPFFLYRFGSKCPLVRGARVRNEFIQWDTENYDNNNKGTGSHPDARINRRFIRLYYCYYTPLQHPKYN